MYLIVKSSVNPTLPMHTIYLSLPHPWLSLPLARSAVHVSFEQRIMGCVSFCVFALLTRAINNPAAAPMNQSYLMRSLTWVVLLWLAKSKKRACVLPCPPFLPWWTFLTAQAVVYLTKEKREYAEQAVGPNTIREEHRTWGQVWGDKKALGCGKTELH